jgi:hypothetical protein
MKRGKSDEHTKAGETNEMEECHGDGEGEVGALGVDSLYK